MNYWCLITSKENWQICKNNELFGLDYRYFITLNKSLKKGDKAVIYSHGGNFVAVIEVDSELYYDEKELGWGRNNKSYLYPYRFKIKIIKEGSLHISYSLKEENQQAKHVNPNPIDNIIFIADKSKTWNIYLQVSILSISRSDFEYIYNNL